MKTVIYWNARHVPPDRFQEVKRRIQERFNLPRCTTVNGETLCDISDEELPVLRECEKRGFIQIRNKPTENPYKNQICPERSLKQQIRLSPSTEGKPKRRTSPARKRRS